MLCIVVRNQRLYIVMTAIHLLNNRRFVFVLHLFQQNTIKFRKKSPSKALFDGLIFGGVYIRREICVSKSKE